MLNILELASDPLIQKLQSSQQSTIQTHFNALLDKLKERNLNNSILIMKYIKKSTKRRVKSKLTLPLWQGTHQKQTEMSYPQQKQTESTRRSPSNCRTAQLQFSIEIMQAEQIFKTKDFKTTNNTNNTMHDLASNSVLKMVQSDTVNLMEHIHRQTKKLSENQLKNTNIHNKETNTFTKYLRNFFISRLTQNIRQQQKKQESKLNSRQMMKRKDSQGNNQEKQKLKVKSLIFGHSQVACANQLTDNNIKDSRSKRLHTEQYQHKLSKSRYNKIFQQQHKSKRAILPHVHNSLAVRNKRGLQNFIRFHQDKARKQKWQDFRTVKLPTQANLIYKESSISNRKMILNKLSALHVRKM